MKGPSILVLQVSFTNSMNWSGYVICISKKFGIRKCTIVKALCYSSTALENVIFCLSDAQ